MCRGWRRLVDSFFWTTLVAVTWHALDATCTLRPPPATAMDPAAKPTASASAGDGLPVMAGPPEPAAAAVAAPVAAPVGSVPTAQPAQPQIVYAQTVQAQPVLVAQPTVVVSSGVMYAKGYPAGPLVCPYCKVCACSLRLIQSPPFACRRSQQRSLRKSPSPRAHLQFTIASYFTHIMQATVSTNVTMQPGLLTWLLCAGLCLIGCWPCAPIPFCVDSTMDTVHSCPSCNVVLGVAGGL